MAQGVLFPLRQLDYLLRARGERNVPGRVLAAAADDLLDLLAYRFQADPQRLQGPGRHTVALVHQAEQQVLGADVVVVEHPGFFLRQDDDPPGPIGEPLEHAAHRPSLPCLSRTLCITRYISFVEFSRAAIATARTGIYRARAVAGLGLCGPVRCHASAGHAL